jgi:hypothetical protein
MNGVISLKNNHTNVGTIIRFHSGKGGITVYNESFTQSFRVVGLKDMKDGFPCTGAGILGVGTVFEIDEKGQCLYTLGHHIDCPLQTVY